MPTDHLDDLRAKAKYARERYQLYKAKAYGQRPTSLARLRELQRAYEQSEQRLRFARLRRSLLPMRATARRIAADPQRWPCVEIRAPPGEDSRGGSSRAGR